MWLGLTLGCSNGIPLTNSLLSSEHLINILSYPVVLRAPSASYISVLAESSARAARDAQSETRTPISDLSSIFSCCDIGEGCYHGINPWSNADAEIQALSTAALQAFQEHVAQNIEPFVHMHEVANKEIASRKLDSRFAKSDASTSSKQIREVLFDAGDFGPPIGLVDDQVRVPKAVCGQSQSERRYSIARMSLAWVSETRETARLRRLDSTRPTSVNHRRADEGAVIIDVESAEPGLISFEDVEGLEDEMDSYRYI